jgi:uncharacterized protein YceK
MVNMTRKEQAQQRATLTAIENVHDDEARQEWARQALEIRDLPEASATDALSSLGEMEV